MSASKATLYGTGIFTTIRIVDGKPWLWEKHWRRLEHDAAKVGIDISSHTEYMVRRGLDESIPDTDMAKSQKARITISDERPSPLWSDLAVPVATNITFLVAPLSATLRPFCIGVSPHLINSTSPLAGLKTCNYLEQTMAMNEAKGHGFNEAVRVNEHGHITSGCMANIFWSKDGMLLTPGLTTGCLPGTTREFILENLEGREVEASIDELQAADSIFLTSAGLGVVEVAELESRQLKPIDHPILNLLPKRI